MYLHVGNSKNIRTRDIIGIFDTDTSTVSAVTRKYLGTAERRCEVEAAGIEIPKSFVLYRVTEKNGNAGSRVCFSQLSTASLRNRSEEGTAEQEKVKRSL